MGAMHAGGAGQANQTTYTVFESDTAAAKSKWRKARLGNKFTSEKEKKNPHKRQDPFCLVASQTSVVLTVLKM